MSEKSWPDVVLRTLKQNDVRLAVYVPDKVLVPLIQGVHGDAFFTPICATREEEGVGICAGAWMGGLRSVLMMQTSGFSNTPNGLASLAVAFQIPIVMLVSERGTLGEFQIGQTWSSRVLAPVCDALGIPHHTLDSLDTLEFMVERSIKQAVSTSSPVALVLSPLLTGGKVLAAP
ncbi:MAG: decarboxylase [Candidatus Eremiobacteraeota bacterium]|nr:decarboxylase [Candidatus Eremiobacteraeota bacterium]